LLWETYDDVQYRPFLADPHPRQAAAIQCNSSRKKLKIVLDGQQRLQSLYTAICGCFGGKSLFMDVLGSKESRDVSAQQYEFRYMDAAEFHKWQDGSAKDATGERPCYLAKLADLISYGGRERAALRKHLATKFKLSEADEEQLELTISS